jgi:hypothetical protein
VRLDLTLKRSNEVEEVEGDVVGHGILLSGSEEWAKTASLHQVDLRGNLASLRLNIKIFIWLCIELFSVL